MGRGRSKAGKLAEYGTEFSEIKGVNAGKSIKFVKPNSGATTAPMYTKTKGRVYATVDKDGDVRFISFYSNKKTERNSGYDRVKQIDLKGIDHVVDGERIIPHTHHGYNHDENGTTKPSNKEQKVIDKVVSAWNKYNNKK